MRQLTLLFALLSALALGQQPPVIVEGDGYRLELPPGWRTSDKGGGKYLVRPPGDSFAVFILPPEPLPEPLTTLDDLKAAAARLAEGLQQRGGKVVGFATLPVGEEGVAAFVELAPPAPLKQPLGNAILFHPRQAFILTILPAPFAQPDLGSKIEDLLARWTFTDGSHAPSREPERLTEDVAFTDLGLRIQLPRSFTANTEHPESVAARFQRPDGLTLDVWGSATVDGPPKVVATWAAEKSELDWSHTTSIDDAVLPILIVRPHSGGQPTDAVFAIVDAGTTQVVFEFTVPAVDYPFRAATLDAIVKSAVPYQP